MVSTLQAQEQQAEWYAVRVRMGFEQAVCRTLTQVVDSLGLKEKILDVVVPMEKQIKVRGGKRIEKMERIYPGFIIVHMIIDDQTWFAVNNVEHVTGFVGSRTRAEPISKEEVETIFQRMKQDNTKHEIDVRVGDPIRIVDGPFSDLAGKVKELAPEKGQVTVLISMFGRETPVTLDLYQIRAV